MTLSKQSVRGELVARLVCGRPTDWPPCEKERTTSAALAPLRQAASIPAPSIRQFERIPTTVFVTGESLSIIPATAVVVLRG